MNLAKWWDDTSRIVGTAGMVYGLAIGIGTAIAVVPCQVAGYHCPRNLPTPRAQALAEQIDGMGDGYEWQAVPVEKRRK
jgi:hypothetical protein